MGTHVPGRRALAVTALGLLLCLIGGAGRVSAQNIDAEGFKARVFDLLNQQRAANGLPALQRVVPLETSAQAFSETMAQATAGGVVYLSHTSPDGSSPADRISRAGYHWTTFGENIAAGQPSPQAVVDAWMNSPGHRANILNGAFRDIGIGLAAGPGTWSNGYADPQVLWWTTDFGNSSESYPAVDGSTPPLPAAPPNLTPAPATTPATSPPQPSQPATAPTAIMGPAIAALVGDHQQPISTISSGELFLIRGQGFGANGSGLSHVLLVANGVEIAAASFYWSDKTIGALAPYFSGPMEVVVQVDRNGTPLISNPVSLTIQ